MKRYFKVSLLALFLLLIVLSSFMVRLITDIQSYGKLINYVGIVRGATQRLIKLEISQQPNDGLIVYLDQILQELNTGEGDIGLILIDDTTYLNDLDQLNAMWGEIKTDIQNVRMGYDSAEVLQLSERYFELANDTVFAAETYSNTQTQSLFVMIMAALLIWLCFLIAYVQQMFRLEKKKQELNEKIYRDKLTGASNLEKFKIDADQIIEEHKNKKFAVIYADFENFKYVNDVFGYEYGDSILKEYVTILKNSMSTLDTFCRVSADNFVIMRCYDKKENLLDQQKKVDEQISEFAMNSKNKYYISLYCGICCVEDVIEQIKVAGLVERANFAKMTVKNQTINRYAFYNESIRNKMRAEKAIENQMRSALETKQFVVYLQPKVSLTSNKINCSEALVRWIMPIRGMVPPDEFIPIFEKNMFIVSLDQYVMEEVCRWLRRQMDEGYPVKPVSVNVSKMQLYEAEFVKTYASIKNKYGIPENMLEIEFTESVVFENFPQLLQIVDNLKREGFRCSLDDFGKGYSSLNLLKNLPVDVLKLDGLFFDEQENRAKARTVITGIVSMVKNLHIEIVAEGVEKEEQVEFLRKIGCDLVQGYVFYRPMPMNDFEKLLIQES